MACLLSEHKELSKIFTKLHKKMKLPIKDFFSKYDQVCRFLWIWSHLQRKSLMENFNFCAVQVEEYCVMEMKINVKIPKQLRCLWTIFISFLATTG